MLPPIKIKLPDRNYDMSLYQVPIKIRICDRDKNMGRSYEKRQVKVREKDGKVVIKYKEDVLKTDKILEYLSNDYIKPIIIKLSIIDFAYVSLHKLLFRHIIAEALDIFKVDGLKALLKFNHKSSGIVKILQKGIDYGAIKFKSPDVTKSAVYIITKKRTIEELTTGTIEDKFSNDKTIFDILYEYRAEQEDPDFYD